MPRDQRRNPLAVLERELPGEGVSPADVERVIALLRREYGGRRLYVNGRPPPRIVVLRHDPRRG